MFWGFTLVTDAGQDIMTDPLHTSDNRRRIVLVTGTSSGIGLAVAVAAAQSGWHTVATMRDPARADRLREAAEHAGVTLDIRRLDVTDSGSVTAALEGAIDTYGRLDAVVNNAGAAAVGTAETLELDAFRAAMEVNFFGVVQVTRAALPHLRATRGRVVTVSSVGGVVGQPFNDAYCAAKFAVEGFLESLHPVARSVGVGVVIIEPGAVASDFIRNAGIRPEVMLAEAGPYAPALAAYLDRTMRLFSSSAQPAGEVARTVVGTLLADDPPLRIQTSEAARQFAAVKLADLDGSRVTAMTREWLSSEP